MSLTLASSRHEVGSTEAAQELFQVNGWSDGLPITPPTPELVEHFMVASGLAPGEIIVNLREQSRTVTVEQIAVNTVAAGCRPEYLPVVVTALRAMNEEPYNLHSTTVSGATAPLVIVSGDAVDLLGVNSGFSVFGSGHVANDHDWSGRSVGQSEPVRRLSRRSRQSHDGPLGQVQLLHRRVFPPQPVVAVSQRSWCGLGSQCGHRLRRRSTYFCPKRLVLGARAGPRHHC